jgi:hypothetical protein
MSIVITLDSTIVHDWTVDMINEKVDVGYSLSDDTGKIWFTGHAIFWRNIPELTDDDGNPLPTPDNWFQLPESYVSTLVSITNAIESALSNKFLN